MLNNVIHYSFFLFFTCGFYGVPNTLKATSTIRETFLESTLFKIDLMFHYLVSGLTSPFVVNVYGQSTKMNKTDASPLL